ncbi:MAG: YdcF family protein [Oscillatoria sp. Prado101]|nr:YdcF family protein [Oscillatoria sp. Prado101]
MLPVNHIHSFLAVNSPIPADVLVVEGWLPDYAIKAAMTEFKSGSYRYLITTGVALPIGFYLAEYKTWAEVGAATLLALGFDRERLAAVPAHNALKDRTAAAAVALKEWLPTSDLQVSSINLYTMGAHARRSWFIFKEALAPDIKVGIIAAEPLDYDPRTWWQSSAGVKTVMFEAIGYVYARFGDWRN